MNTLIFDCDGVLSDTERDGHLPAFNQTFREFGLPVTWSEADYGEKLKIGGGKERMASLLTPAFVSAAVRPAYVLPLTLTETSSSVWNGTSANSLWRTLH